MAKRTYQRVDGRKANELRPVRIQPDFVSSADGSCLIELGGTRVICTASIDPGVPRWRANSGKGWLTAEYGMLPASTGRRKSRPLLKRDGRTVEIQRLIGRCLRMVVDFAQFADKTIYLDCDVLEADGGTRTAAITGAYVALCRATARASAEERIGPKVVTGQIAAVSVGVVEGQPLLDLCYAEDSTADVDMNLAMTGAGRFVELQGSAESKAFTADQLEAMIRLGKRGIRQLRGAQNRAIGKRTNR